MRYGRQPIPTTKRAFIAALKRAEAKAYRAAANCIRKGETPEQIADRLRVFAQSRDDDAVFLDKLDPTAADADSLTVSMYKEALRGHTKSANQ